MFCIFEKSPLKEPHKFTITIILKWGLYSLFGRFHRDIFVMLLINDLENRECFTKELKNMNARSRTPAKNLIKLA
jgi:hypothetical protein